MRPNPVGWFLVAFFLIGGIAFTIAIPGIWIGQIWIAVALFLGALYLFLGRRAAKQEELRRTGIPGTARILEMTQTGMYVNEQPQVRLRLRVEGRGIAPYEIQKSVVVPLIALGRLSSGQPLTVFIDKEDRENLLIDWSGGGAGAPFTISPEGGEPVSVGDPAAQQAVLRALHEHGVDPSRGSVDLRQMPAARAAVLDALRRHGIDAAHATAAADPTTPVQQEEEGQPLERLTKLMQLKNAQLITDEEFAEHKQRILGEL